MGIVGIGYWSSEPCGYWVLEFRARWVLGGEFLQNGVTVIFGFDFGSSSSSGWWQQGAVSARGCSGWIAQCER